MEWTTPITLKTSEIIAIFRKKLDTRYSKLHFHNKLSVVPRSDNDYCASLLTIMLNYSIFSCASELRLRRGGYRLVGRGVSVSRNHMSF